MRPRDGGKKGSLIKKTREGKNSGIKRSANFSRKKKKDHVLLPIKAIDSRSSLGKKRWDTPKKLPESEGPLRGLQQGGRDHRDSFVGRERQPLRKRRKNTPL